MYGSVLALTLLIPGAHPAEKPDCTICADVEKVCVAEPIVKKSKPCYSSKCTDYCLPGCFSKLLGGDCSSCGKVRTKHWLVVKRYDEPGTKCVPVVAPTCGQPACPQPRQVRCNTN